MFTINAKIRKEHGKGASRRLRAVNKFPAIIYSINNNESSLCIELEHNLIMNMQNLPEFYIDSFWLKIDDQKIKVKVKDVQRHPFKPKIQHMDFIRT